MVNAQGWAKWLNEHASRATYDRYPERVTRLLSDSGNPEVKFERISRNKNLVLLTKAPVGKKCSATFFHSVIGCPITPDELRFAAKSGMEKGTGVELDPSSIFTSTTAKYVPSLADLMKVSRESEVEDLKAPRSGQKRKTSNFALLTPALAEVGQRTNMKPSSLLVAFVEEIKARATAPRAPSAQIMEETGEQEDVDDESSEEGREGSGSDEEGRTENEEDKFLEELGKPYESVLRFLWVLHHHPSDMQAPAAGILADPELVEWDIEVEKLIRPAAPPASVAPQPQTIADLGNRLGATTAMTKLSEALTKYQEVAARAHEEKSDVKLKVWNRLPQIQQSIILFGGIDEDNEVPSTPMEEMLAILGCQNGAQVDQYLKQVMIGHNVSFEPGLCSALNKGLIVHADDGTLPKNFSCFLTPPMKDDEGGSRVYLDSETCGSVEIHGGGRDITHEDTDIRTDECTGFEAAHKVYCWVSQQVFW